MISRADGHFTLNSYTHIHPHCHRRRNFRREMEGLLILRFIILLILFMNSWLWELRPGGDRVLFFAWTGGAFVLLHAFRKQSQKTPDAELHKAEREYKDWIERNGKI